MPPRVSILLPVYNAEKYLPEALQSITCQTFPHFEVIAVNDGSTDQTADLLNALHDQDPRFRVFHLPSRTGIVSALNFGLKHACAPYIARMDADDIMHPARLENQHEFLEENSSIDIAGCLVEKFSSQAILRGYRRYIGWLNSLCDHETICRDMFVESPLAHPSVMMRSETLLSADGYQDHGWPEDYDLWMRLFIAGKRFGKVEKILLRWRDEPNRLSRTDGRYSLDNFYRCKTYYLSTFLLKDRREVIVWGAKRTSRRFSSMLREYNIRIKAYVDVDRKKIGRRTGGIPIIDPDGLQQFRTYPVLSYVSIFGARDKIRSYLVSHEYREGRDFFMLA